METWGCSCQAVRTWALKHQQGPRTQCLMGKGILQCSVSNFKDLGKGSDTHSRSENTVFDSCGCYNKLAQTGWLQAMEIYCPSFGGQESEIKLSAGPYPLWKLWGRICFSPLAASGGCKHSLTCSCITPISCLHLPVAFSRVSISNLPLPLSSKDTYNCIEDPPR